MDADSLYQELKQAWDYLGVGFHGRHLVSVAIEGKQLVLTYEGKEARIILPVYQ